MQTFSNMRRNSSHKQTLLSILLFVGFYIYESIASMNIWLPPLVGVCLALFVRYDKQDNLYRFLAIIGYMVVIESENELPMGMLLALFLLLAFFVIPRIRIMFDSVRITRIACVILAYIGLLIASIATDILTGNTTPNVWILLYYAVWEIIIVMFMR